MRRAATTTLTALSLLALTACGGSSTSITDTSYDNVKDLKAAVTDAGLPCQSDSVFKGEGVKEAIKCGDKVWLGVYQDDKQKNARVDEYRKKENSFVAGPNWTVVAPQKELDKLS